MLRKTVKGQHGAYDVYSTTPQGQQALRGLSGASPPPLMLPVPASVREEDLTLTLTRIQTRTLTLTLLLPLTRCACHGPRAAG